MDYFVETIDARPEYHKERTIRNIVHFEATPHLLIFTTEKNTTIKLRTDTWRTPKVSSNLNRKGWREPQKDADGKSPGHRAAANKATTRIIVSRPMIKKLPYLEYKAYAEDDLNNVAEWFKKDISELSFEFKYESIGKFKKQITEMLQPSVEDWDRIKLIIDELKEGTQPYAIFVDKNDNFILEGRHRIMAFYRSGLDKIPVYYVYLKESKVHPTSSRRT